MDSSRTALANSFRQSVMHKARRLDEQDSNSYLKFLWALPEYTPAPGAHWCDLSDDCWIWDLPEKVEKSQTGSPLGLAPTRPSHCNQWHRELFR